MTIQTVVLDSDLSSRIERNVDLQRSGQWASDVAIERMESVQGQANTVSDSTPGSDYRGPWLDRILRLSDERAKEAWDGTWICGRAYGLSE